MVCHIMKYITAPIVRYHIQNSIAYYYIIVLWYVIIRGIRGRIILLALLALIWFYILYIEPSLFQVSRSISKTA